MEIVNAAGYSISRRTLRTRRRARSRRSRERLAADRAQRLERQARRQRQGNGNGHVLRARESHPPPRLGRGQREAPPRLVEDSPDPFQARLLRRLEAPQARLEDLKGRLRALRRSRARLVRRGLQGVERLLLGAP